MANNGLVGYRFVKRYAPQIVVSGILSLLMVAVPVVLIILPWLTFSAADLGGFTMKGFDLFKYVIALFKGDAALAETEYYSILVGYAIAHPGVVSADISANVLKFLPLGSAIFIALSAVFGLIILIVGVVEISSGRLSHFKAPTVFATLLAICAFINALMISIIYLCYTVFLGTNKSYSFDKWWFCWIYFGGALAIRIAIGCLYEYGIYDHIFVQHSNQMNPVVSCVAATGTVTVNQSIDEQPVSQSVVKLKPDVEMRRNIKQVPIVLNERRDIGLPANITKIGGHEYAENTVLTVAIIPNGIDKLGVGAFANCIKLVSVSIPQSVTTIEANCFFNCVRLGKINYNGTKKEWSRITRGSNWLTKAGTHIVVCTDGAIIVNPYH